MCIFSAISLRSGQVIMTYNLGSGGTTAVTSNFASGTGWVRITAQINGADGQIQLDNGPVGVGRGWKIIFIDTLLSR